MEKLADLPPLAVVIFGATLAVIFAVRYLGLWSGKNATPEKSSASAQVAAVIVDPTALNRASAALEAHNALMVEQNNLSRENIRLVSEIGDEIGRVREEMRISRELFLRRN